MKKLLVGVGNPMRGDDALGVEVVRDLKSKFPDEAEYLSIQGDLSRLLNMWIGREVILIDCVQSGSDPGRLFEIKSIDQLINQQEILSTTHGMNISQTLELAIQMNQLPEKLTFFGIEGKSFDMGADLSSEVKESLKNLLNELSKLLS